MDTVDRDFVELPFKMVAVVVTEVGTQGEGCTLAGCLVSLFPLTSDEEEPRLGLTRDRSCSLAGFRERERELDEADRVAEGTR